MPFPALDHPGPALNREAPEAPSHHLPGHVPLAVQTRDGLVESIHYGSVIALNTPVERTTGTRTLFTAGDPLAAFYPRSALKPLQAVAMVRAGLDLPDDLLALTAASHSGAQKHVDGVHRILEKYGLTAAALENSSDLPYGTVEREEWLRSGRTAAQVSQNCSGKHASMAATCVINGWPVTGYLDPGHPLQRLVAQTVSDLTGEQPSGESTDGCGTPLFAVTLHGMARAFGVIARAAAKAATEAAAEAEGASAVSGVSTAEGAVGLAMQRHPDMVAGEHRDVTEFMRLVPGAVAKDGFQGVQLIGLPDGRAIAVKISDGGDSARMPVAVRVLGALGVDTGPLAAIARIAVLGGDRAVGALQALHFPSEPVKQAPHQAL